MLPRLHTDMMNDKPGPLTRRASKRQKIANFFKSWKHRQSHPRDKTMPPTKHVDDTGPTPPPVNTTAPDHGSNAPAHHPDPHGLPPPKPTPAPQPQSILPPPPPQDTSPHQTDPLTLTQLHVLFAGAPQFRVAKVNGRRTPTASFPWSVQAATKDATDVAPLAEPAFSAATLRKHSLKAQPLDESPKEYNGYAVDAVETPSMLGTQGIEPGTVGFAHFLELPESDVLLSQPQASQSAADPTEATKNKELLHTNPERLGIRSVDLRLIYDRLGEFQDMYEAFHDSPEPMTILNTQTSGDLYANLFTKFLTPPGYDGATDDPTGMQTQIAALLRVLDLKGIWYDFSLVEWRIRLGQILWSEPDLIPEHEHDTQPLWTEREILLLQITLACELLLRLDAYTNADAADAAVRLRINPQDVEAFLQFKTRKIDWDLVLARTFLDNIAIMGGSQTSPKPKSGGLLSLFAENAHHEMPQSDLILFPQHQTRQISGLLHFATVIQWPGLDVVSAQLVRKLAPQIKSEDTTPSSPSGRLTSPESPSGFSVYATPLQTPPASSFQMESYFGQTAKPALERNNSRAFHMALTPTLPALEDQSTAFVNNVGGWLSRSYLTGLVLPGEAISHLLISTLLENDEIAVANLGHSANLYGGFTFGDRTFWSKNSIVGRILACVKGSAECMGWVSCPKLPENPAERWYSIHSEVLPYENRVQERDGSDVVSRDSAIVPGDSPTSVKSEDFVLPRDLDPMPTSSLGFSQWELVPMNADLIDGDSLTGPYSESDIHSPAMTFVSADGSAIHTLTLAYDIQFVTSWPCTPAASGPASTHRPRVLRRSVTGTLSRSSSKHSETMSRRNSHGFEPLLSHPPDAPTNEPKRMYDVPDEMAGEGLATGSKPLDAHLLHKLYSYKIIPVTDILDPDFLLPFELHTSKSSERILALSQSDYSEADTIREIKKAVLVLDARTSWDLEVLARAWCAERGLHALVSRVGRTCLACSIREARGLGIHIVIRV
ncbi:hypothetical protein COCCADRAFT_32043 [Bipolaris zeicola 26-R-13]|uniref:Uncharacterized protein n=1 Tax=Cochliobolus carbonum (strain 26-R-13) TaxID=930089 RepID=W6YMF7_COCC2|nr:uncharacterized protein COCCADRAFT_32043 [Bipolaris zeicola 26-R-13]EUC39000.1 hypothetical protein COCCADRAFT_32043 [Bipolaris zeicola 26-R-13]